MPIPPRGDPRRPLQLAIRSMRLLGGILLLFSTCATAPFFLRGGRPGGVPWVALIGMLFYLAPGICFIVFAVFLARRQFWAVVASLCLASASCLLMLGALAFFVTFALRDDFQPILLVPLGVIALIVVALGQLIYHLARSFEAIRIVEPQERGFEPIMMQNPNDETRNPNQ